MNGHILSKVVLCMNQSDVIRFAPISKKSYKLVYNYYQKLVVKSNDVGLYCKENRILELCKLMKSHSNLDWDYGLYSACLGGHRDIIELMIKKGACLGGHRDIIELMIKKGANNWGLYSACEGGYLDIVELMVEKGANEWNWGLYGACEGGHRDIMELMIEKGANDWNYGLEGACLGGNLDLVELMIEKGANNCNWCDGPH